jgi:thioesterase domain-containing protein/acyl carrier protein
MENPSKVEQTLLPLWEEILGVHGIGRHDDFFELGGQSLMAVHLVSELERVFGGRIPLGWIFEHPTVARLAKAIESRPPQAFEGPEFLVPIRATGSLAPLFCVHGVAGGVFAYREAAKLLGPERPVWGIMLVGRPIDRIPRTVEAMAERYLEEIRTVQPEGPYSVIGYSFGCLVAYEMASRLVAGGEGVAFVGLVTPPDQRTPASRLRRSLVLAKRALTRRAPTITTVCLAAAAAYRPRPFPGRIVYFRAASARPGRSEGLWGRLALGGLDVRTVPGEHLTIMQSDNAPEFAVELRSALAEIETPG